MATLVRAEPMDAGAAAAEIAGAWAERTGHGRVLCEPLGGWDVWALEQASAPDRAYVAGDFPSPWFPPSFGNAFVLQERSTNRVWLGALPLLPAACADSWMGTGAGAPCEPTPGIGVLWQLGDPRPVPQGSADPHALVFFGEPWDASTSTDLLGASYGASCPLEPDCCPGLTPLPRFCADSVASTWLAAACAATSLDAIPIPTAPPPCAAGGASPYPDGALPDAGTCR